MLADELDYVIGVDPQRDTHAFAVVDVRSGGVVFEATARFESSRAHRIACKSLYFVDRLPRTSMNHGLSRDLRDRGSVVIPKRDV